jgi:hypothetical protein
VDEVQTKRKLKLKLTVSLLKVSVTLFCCGGSSAVSLFGPAKPNPAIMHFLFFFCRKDLFDFQSSRPDKDKVISNLGTEGFFFGKEKFST